MSLLGEVVSALEAAGIQHALIGATAIAVHGISRATADLDLFTVDGRALDEGIWRPLAGRRAEVRLLKGDFDDPLAGSVRLQRDGTVVDVVVGRYAWQRDQIAAAVVRSIGEIAVPVVEPAGLVLLKLHAGGPKDAWDVQSLLEIADDPAGLAAEVERTLPQLPPDARALWARIHGRERS
jgi:hypothetical protein